ncbi:hypothetical protein MP228_004111 [Amoeboaphelidium protococcarum]|nr:hypothetical protein MP228_004111 [Amoeboaphelidium protococcarum]
MQTPVFRDTLNDQSEIKVRVYDRDQLIDWGDFSGQQSSAISQKLQADALEIKSLLQPLDQVYAQRRLEFDQFVQSPECTVETRVDDDEEGYAPGTLRMIKNPTASKLSHTLFHPAIYRSVKSLGCGEDGLDNLAQFLGVGKNWKVAAAYCEQDDRVKEQLSYLQDDSNESTFSLRLAALMVNVCLILDVFKYQSLYCERCAVIGGVMCDQSYDYGSKMDIYFTHGPQQNPASPIYFGTELKTCRSYPDDHIWYTDTRLAQVLAALYSLNAPILLATPSQFKVFVENKNRDAIFTYPYCSSDDDGAQSASMASSHTDKVSENLVKVLVILLSRFGKVRQFRYSKRTKSVVPSPPKSPIKALYANVKDTVQKLTKKLNFLTGRQKAIGNKAAVIPRFIVGYDADWSPLYQEVRVASRETAETLMATDEEPDDLYFFSSAWKSSSIECTK